MKIKNIFIPPGREYACIAIIFVGFLVSALFDKKALFLIVVAVIAILPTAWEAFLSISKLRISIDVFNMAAVIISAATGEFRSTGFIALMLSFARLLEAYTASRTKNAIQEILKLKPLKAEREIDGRLEEIDVDDVKQGDIILIKIGQRAPVDGVVVFGVSFVNESSVTGESRLLEKVIGDEVLSSTLVESGLMKIKATRVGKDSTIERMAQLMREAAQNKSRSEKMADKFAGAFLPLVAFLGLAVYLVTKNLSMTAALFLVACADDMAVAIPLAMTASLGQAARRGVIIKGGEWLDVLSKIKTLILDKTGTLTYGSLSIKNVEVTKDVDENLFWKLVAAAEKFSEHPVGKMVYREAAKRFHEVPDPDDFKVWKGSGVWARLGSDEIVTGSLNIVKDLNLKLPVSIEKTISSFYVFINKQYAGTITVADQPRKEAAESLKQLSTIGVGRIIMLTGDDQETAKQIASGLGITEFKASLKPEQKLKFLEQLVKSDGTIGMVGDGINDAPVLARADVGIAMGGGGTAVAVEAADVVILTDDLSRIPEMIKLGRRTLSVIHYDVAIWLVSNFVGFALVLTGIAGPAFAAFYNFATDFFPLINSTRLFRRRKN
ncbi:MAG: heavy metal translocating P-type ATPase [Patescibacteria group bacterium]